MHFFSKRRRRFFYIFLLPFAYLLLAYLCIPFALETDYAREYLSTYLTEQLGRDVTIANPIRARVFPYLEVTLQNVSISNITGLRRKKMLTAGRVSVSAPILENIVGKYHINRIDIANASVQIASNESGLSNTHFTKSSSDKTQKARGDRKFSLPELDEISLNNIHLMLGDGEREKAFFFQSLSLDHLFDQDSTLSTALRISDRPLRMTGSSSPIQSFINDGSLNFDLQIYQDTLTLKSTGQIRKTGNISAQIHLYGQDTADLNNTLHLNLPPWKDYDLKTNFNFDGRNTETLDFKKTTLTISGNDLSGDIQLQLSPLRITAELSSKSLDLAEVFSHSSESPQSDDDIAQTTGQKLEPHIPFSAFEDIQANLTLEVADLKTFLGLQFNNAKLDAELMDSALHVKGLDANAFGGEFTSTMLLAKDKIKASFHGSRMRVNPLIELSGGKTLIDGKFNLEFDVESQGEYLSEILHELDGTLKITSENGKIKSRILESTSTNLFEIVSPLFKKSDAASVECLLLNFEIKKGIAKSREQVLKVGQAFFFAEGKLNLNDSSAKYNFHINSKNPSLTSLIPPFRAYGKIGNLTFLPSVSGTVASAADTTEGIARAAFGALKSTAQFLTGNSAEDAKGIRICELAYESEQALLSSRVGSVIDD